jgi:D-alanyl-D-alanine carboxypeptidase
MAYYTNVLQPGENVRYLGRLHLIISGRTTCQQIAGGCGVKHWGGPPSVLHWLYRSSSCLSVLDATICRPPEVKGIWEPMSRVGLIASFVLAISSILIAAQADALAGATAISPAVQDAIDGAVGKERAVYGGNTAVPGVLIGVWDKDGSNYTRAYGDADLANGRKLTPEDYFRIGSNTKTFVVSVLLQLIDEKALRLDDPVSKFSIGVTIPNAQNITIRQLCEMRSGLFEAYDTPELRKMTHAPAQGFDPHVLIGWAVAQKPYFAPGAGYNYSNTNYLILGLIVESVTKTSVADEITTRLLLPFHLTSTSYPATDAMPTPWAHGYALDSSKHWQDISGTIPVSLTGPAGAMISTLGDMRRWVVLYVTGKTNAPATQQARLNCLPTGEGNLSYGLGIGCSAGWYGYTGGLPGYNTAAYYDPVDGITILAWVTLQKDQPPPDVANAVFRDIAAILTPTHVPYSP